MNRNFKAIGAAVLAAVMCASSAGCAKKEDTGVYVDKDGNISINESKLEDHVNSVFGGDTNNPTSSASEISEPKEVKLEPTDEIKNAALNSGLVQYNNDIFQRGGYITVPDFVEKYKDSYDISYINAGSYDECKDYLLEYGKDFLKARNTIGVRWNKKSFGRVYYLTLTPKNGSNCNPVRAYVVNATSPDEKITLDKAIVAEIEGEYSDYKFITPEWFPFGLNSYYFKDNYDSENKSYTVETLCEALEAKGLTKNSEFKQGAYSMPSSSKEENHNTYWKQGSDAIGCYIVGEENLFGAKPLYYYWFTIDSNTDKLSYAECFLEYFIKD